MSEIPVKGCSRSFCESLQLLLECHSCRESLRDPVVLDCLHSCCRTCLESSGTCLQTAMSTINCPVCSEATEPNAIVANSFLYNYQRMSALYSDDVMCSTCDAQQETAEFWCADCCMGLCASCYVWHNRFSRRHRSAELDVARKWSFSQLTPAAQCNLHKRQIQVQCITCCQPKCLLCCNSCKAVMHDLQPLSYNATRWHDAIKGATERLGCLLQGLRQKSRSIANRIQKARKSSDVALMGRKRTLQDSVDRAFNRSLTEACINLQRILHECLHCMDKPSCLSETVTSAARHIMLFSITRVCSMYVLREKRAPQTVIHWCISSCRASLRRLLWCVRKSGSFVVDSSVPLTADIVLRGCLGATERRRASPAAPLIFGQVCRSFRAHVDCTDLGVTREGHVLLAALDDGLLVYNDRGQQVSSWRPAKRGNGRDDQVNCVAVLSDRQAAVGVIWAQTVVLLRQSSETGDSWLEDRRVTVRQAPPWRLAAHGDLLAATEGRRGEQQPWSEGCQMILVRLSSGQLLYRQDREYDIRKIALTALCVVTTSSASVKRNTGLRPHLVDAFSHAGEFLWRYETSDDEGVTSLCAAETWYRVYVIVLKKDGSSSRVIAINGADGRVNSDVLSTRTHGMRNPVILSLARREQHTVLTVLSADGAPIQTRKVTVYEAMGK